MGGGDLNLKKSWHPSTFHNLEKVWKLEQRHEAEKKKIEQLQQEIKEERAREEMQRMAVEVGVSKKRDDRVEWLYSGPGSSVNRDEYLLGKRIDKAVDPTLVEEEREREALATSAGALFTSADGAGSSTDLAVKIREDPLFLIRKKEEDAKKLLASNPVKMKQLQQLVSRKREGKKHKKAKKRRREVSPDSDDEPNQKRKAWKVEEREFSSSREGSRHRHSTRDRSRHDSEGGSRHASGEGSRHDSDEGSRHDSGGHSRHRSSYSTSRSHTRHMNPEELQKRREDMAAFARQHDREREQRLRRHEVEREEEEEESRKQHSSDFLQPLRMKSLTSAKTVGERIHRSKGSVQRTSAALAGNFMQK